MAPATRHLPAIATQSLGRSYAGHTIESKLSAASHHGFRAIELFYEDLEAVATSLPSSPSSTWDDRLLAAADHIHTLCTNLNLTILCLQPFMHYEGLLDRDHHAERIEKLYLWFALVDHLNTDLIQIPSNFLPQSQCTSDIATIVADLQEVADLGLRHQPRPIRFAYEALCWATHIDHWDQAWDIVKTVDRPNFGTCLDTFNICGRVYADPASHTGKNVDADRDMAVSMQKMVMELKRNVDKIFYVEIVDAERMKQPLTPDHPWHVDGQKARMSWSRNARLFPFESERGAYLPVLEVFKVITQEVGYEGYVSFEYFNRSCNVEGGTVPEEHARRGEVSWARLVECMGWEEDEQQKAETDELEDVQAVAMERKDSGVADMESSSEAEQDKKRQAGDAW